MKVLLVHNYYGSASPSGENQVFEIERSLLRSRGLDVSEFVRHSDEIRAQGAYGLLRGAVSTPWNPWMARKIRREIDSTNPDIVHVHNTFPLLSPSIFHAIGQRAARVMTLHNYRLFCPAAIPVRRDSGICLECVDQQSVLPSLKHACYRGTRLSTLPLAANVWLHRFLGTWASKVDAFIALTDFQRDLMIHAGLPKDRVFVKPNFFPGKPDPLEWGRRDDCVVFAGRLSEEKGVRSLVKAWALWGNDAPELRIIGDGPLRSELEHLANGLHIRFLGQVDATKAQFEIARAKLLVLPSEWFECFPMVVREAFAFATPVAVSSVGPLPSIVGGGTCGIVFASAQPASLLENVRAAWNAPNMLRGLGQKGRAEFEAKYMEDTNYRMLMSIYEEAISINKGIG